MSTRLSSAPRRHRDEESDAPGTALTAAQVLQLQQTALEHATNAFLIADAAGVIQWTNPAFSALTGYGADEVRGRTPALLKSGAHDRAFYAGLWSTLRRGDTWRGEFTNRRKDGSLYQVEQVITPARDGGGVITHYIAIISDVTGRRAAEAVERVTRLQLQQLLEHSPAVLYILRLAGDREVPRVVSENITPLLGFTVAEALDDQWWAAQLHPADREAALAAARETRQRGEAVVEYRVRHRDGSYRWVLDRKRLVCDPRGTPESVIGVWTDITERKRAEEIMSQVTPARAARRLAWRETLICIAVGLATLAVDIFQDAHNARVGVHSHTVGIDLSNAVVLALGLFFCLMSLRLWRRRVHQRENERHAAEALHQLHAELDRRVQQRTAELARANEILRVEIAERQRAEAALESERSLVRTVIDLVPDLIYLKDDHSRFVVANQATARIMAVDEPAQLLGRTDADFHSFERAREFRADEVHVLNGHTVLDKEEAATDGSGRVFLTTKMPWRDSNGRTVGVVGIGRDITARKQMEEAWQRSEERYRALVDAAPSGIYVNLEGRFAYVNHALCRLLNAKSPEELLGTPVFDRIHPDFHARIRERRALTLTGQTAPLMAQRFVRLDGSVVDVETTATTINFQGRTACQVIINDITARIAADAAIRNLQARYSSLVEQMPAGVYRKDLAGHYVFVNEWFARLTGIAATEFVGQRPSEIGARILAGRESLRAGAAIGAAIFAQGEDHHARIIAGDERAIELEERWQMPDGGWVTLQVTKTPVFDSAGRIIGSQGFLFDITSRQRAEAELHEQREQWRTLVAATTSAVFVVKDERFVFANPATAHMFGLSVDELHGRTIWEFLSEEYHERIRERLQQVWRQPEPLPLIETVWRRPDGGLVAIESSSVQFLFRGEPAVLVEARDIGERRRAAEELREARDKYHAIFENSLEGIYQSTPEGQFLAVNPTMARILGYESAVELVSERRDIGREGYVLPARRDEFKAEIERHGVVHDFEYEARRKDGTRVWVSENAHAIRARDGHVICYEGSMVDITERKRSQLRHALQHAVTAQLAKGGGFADTMTGILERLGEALQCVLAELWMVDRGAGVLQCTQYWRAAGGAVDGLLADGQRLQATFGHTFAGSVWASGRTEWAGNVVEDPRCHRRETAAAAGVSSWIGFPICLRDAVVGVVGFFRRESDAPDASLVSALTAIGTQLGQFVERQQLADQFRQAQKMEAIGTLAGGIAHDFNNIIAAISGYSELAKMESAPMPRVTEHLDAILTGAGRAAALVRQILAFSRQQEQKRAPIQLRHVVSEAMHLLRATIPTTVTFEIHLARDLPTVLADATQVHQVVMNLCTNAWHAMREHGGRLQVTLQPCAVDAALAERHTGLRPGPYARLAIADSGHGMDDGTLARIFEPFFTTKAPGEGTGLGLSVVHGIVQSHDGVITVASRLGAGTTFELYFPAAVETVVPVIANAIVPQGAGQRILFIDDEPPLARMGRLVLEKLGYHADESCNAVEALAAVRSAPDQYDLVVTDLTMPQLTGLELAEQLHEIRPTLPVVLVTGYSANLTANRVRELGLSDLLLKPVTVYGLGSAVARALAATPALSHHE